MNEFWTCEHIANHGCGEACDCVPTATAPLPPDVYSLITVKQLPVIEEQFRLAGQEVTKRVFEADALVCNEENKQTVKKARAELRKEQADFAARFKEVESQILEPLNRIKAAYKLYIDIPFAEGDKRLKEKIDNIEDEEKRQKQEEVVTYFQEYAQSKHLDPYYIKWERTGINVTLSATPKSLKERAKEYVDCRCKHLESIAKREHAEEILVEYRQSLSYMDAVEAVERRHRAIGEQAKRKMEYEATMAAEARHIDTVEAAAVPPLAPPVVKSAGKDPKELIAPAFQLDPTPREEVYELGDWLKGKGIGYKLIQTEV